MKASLKNEGTGRSWGTMRLLLCIALWSIIFIVGVHVNTIGIRAEFSETGRISFYSFIIVAFCWTWSNLIFLCCLSAIIGELGRSFSSLGNTLPNYRVAIVKGFFVYLLALTGQLIVAGTIATPMSNITTDPTVVFQAAYFRLASFVAFMSFLMGYSPHLFTRMVNKLERLAEEGSGPEEKANCRVKDDDKSA